MRVHYQSSVDDAVDINLRLMARSKALRGGRTRDYIPVGIAFGLIIGLLTWLLLREHNGQWEFPAALGSITALVIIVFSPWRVRQRLRRYYREQYGTDDDFDVEVELLPDGLSVRRLGCRIVFDWESVLDIYEAPEFLDIRMRHGGLVCVKKAAFESETQMQRFVDEVERHVTENRRRE